MKIHHITKGKDIRLKGMPSGGIVNLPLPQQAAVQPSDFSGMKPRLAVKEGDLVRVGSPILTDKEISDLKVLSPVSGKVVSVNRGAKRALLEVVVESDGKQDVETFKTFSENDLDGLIAETVTQTLLQGGLWPVIRQRPFNKIANPEDEPASIFIHAMNTEPLSLDIDIALEGKEDLFQKGIDILSKLTPGNIHLCFAQEAGSSILREAKGVEHHQFTGPHPAGNVGTHIHAIDPITKGKVIWFVEAQDVVRVAELFLKGIYPTERVVAVAGEGASKNFFARTIVGAPIKSFLEGNVRPDVRYISGSVLTGKDVSAEGFLCFYDSLVTMIPEGGRRDLLGWLWPGWNKYTFTKTFVSAVRGDYEASIDTDENGGHRAIVLPHLYDKYQALDVMTYFLIRAVISGDIEEAERLGILECDREDFALSTFVCPSKTDIGAIIKSGLDLIEKEG